MRTIRLKACVSAPAQVALAFAMLILPRSAGACPQCVGQQPGGVARIAALGLMMLLPLGIAFVVYVALRRASGPTIEAEVGRRASRLSSRADT
jgi:hypothetical protein